LYFLVLCGIEFVQLRVEKEIVWLFGI